MPGQYDKIIHLSAESVALADELAHQVCQTGMQLAGQYFDAAAGYRAVVDGKPNGDLDAVVVRGALTGKVSSMNGQDLIYEEGRPTKKRVLRVGISYENTELEGAEKLRSDVLYYAKAFTTVFLGTFLAVASNVVAFLTMAGMTNIYVIGILGFLSYAFAAGIGAFFGERIGDIYMSVKGKKIESDKGFDESEDQWCAFVDEYQHEIEKLISAAQSAEA